MNDFNFIWQIPLALLSFIFNKVMKFIIGNVYTIYLAINKKQASTWRVLSAETLKSPLSFPVLMTKAPRWNNHAIIGTLGPFKVKDSLGVNLETIKKSAPSWIFVVYSFPGFRTITNLDSNDVQATDEWISIPLKSGSYTLGLRYYHWFDRVTLPTIKVDNIIYTESQLVDAKVNQFYENLLDKKNFFYSALHYYIYILLLYRKYIPESFLKREFLPVGAPDTDFFYGYLHQGQSLRLQIDKPILENYDIFLSLYDHSSLPIMGCEVKESGYGTNPNPNNGYYLLRIRPQPDCQSPLTIEGLIRDELTQQQTIALTLNPHIVQIPNSF